MSVALYFYLFLLWKPLGAVIRNRYNKTGNEKLLKTGNVGYQILMWGLPMIFLFIFYRKWDNTGMVIFVGILAYILLTIYASAEYVHRKSVNV